MNERKIQVTVEIKGDIARQFIEIRKILGYKRNQTLAAYILRKGIEAERDLFQIPRCAKG